MNSRQVSLPGRLTFVSTYASPSLKSGRSNTLTVDELSDWEIDLPLFDGPVPEAEYADSTGPPPARAAI